MEDNYIINIISDIEKQGYIQEAQSAIDNLRNKISELQQMATDNNSIPTMSEPYQVAFYIKDVIGISNRPSQ